MRLTQSQAIEFLESQYITEPDEVTAQSVADYTGCSWTKAAATLKAKLAAGELTARQVRTQNGKPATAYRKA